MTPSITYAVNAATGEQIAKHLQACDQDFVAGLAARVDITSYSRKIETNAQRFEAWTDERLVGLVAAYCNNLLSRTAFITSVSVIPEWQGRGVGSELLTRCIAYARGLGFLRIQLEVRRDNALAAFYRKQGFASDGPLDEPRDAALTMNLNI